jgi:adenylate cyclase
MKGVELFLHHTKDDNRQALDYSVRAAALDPNYSMAWVTQGWAHWNDSRYSWSAAPEVSMALAWESAEKAVVLDDKNPDALILLATLKLFEHEHAEALDLAEKAVALNGNHSINIAVLGVLLGYSERPQEAIETIQRAIRLSPIYPLWYHQGLAHSYTQLEQYTDAIAQYEAAIIKSPEAHSSYIQLAHPLFLVGEREEARDAIAQGLRLNPHVTVANWRATLPYLNQQRLEDELNSLRQSGLPE